MDQNWLQWLSMVIFGLECIHPLHLQAPALLVLRRVVRFLAALNHLLLLAARVHYQLVRAVHCRLPLAQAAQLHRLVLVAQYRRLLLLVVQCP